MALYHLSINISEIKIRRKEQHTKMVMTRVGSPEMYIHVFL